MMELRESIEDRVKRYREVEREEDSREDWERGYREVRV